VLHASKPVTRSSPHPSSRSQFRRLRGCPLALCTIGDAAPPQVEVQRDIHRRSHSTARAMGAAAHPPWAAIAFETAPRGLSRRCVASSLTARWNGGCPTTTCVSQKDLLEHMDLSHAECLNENPQKPLAYAMKQGYAASIPSVPPRRVLAARPASSFAGLTKP